MVVRVVGLILLAVIFGLIISIHLSGQPLWPDLGINLIAGLTEALLTIWGVGWLLERDRKAKQTRLLRSALLGPLIRCVNAARRLIPEINASHPEFPDSAYRSISRQRGEWRTAAREIAENVKFYTAVLDADTLHEIDNLEKQCLDMATKVNVEPGQQTKVSLYASTMICLCYDVIRIMRAIEEPDSPFLDVIDGLKAELDTLGDSYGIPRE